MGISHGFTTASKAPGSPKHTTAYSTPAKTTAAPTEGGQTSWTCTRMSGAQDTCTRVTHSHACLRPSMGISHGFTTASKAPGSPKHATAYSPHQPTQVNGAVPTEGVKTSRHAHGLKATCMRVTHSHACLRPSMGTSHGFITASKAPGSPKHATAYSPPAKTTAVPTEGVKTSRHAHGSKAICTHE